MTRSDLRNIVAAVLELDAGLLTPMVNLSELPEYDSVKVLNLMVALDDEAGIRLDHVDISRIKSYLDIEKIAIEKGVTFTE